ncbi:hypothetical protein EVAR_48237_1 [Eumeta japonica]|uniref:Uncharacterized protein n=1 Tax=Eumeta variegata TaxID=151549 RepID=A0A4C1YIF1_EUMVA|nr:hypothetical protein EVAR_48237_1 [Eumeta japonica]
MTQKIKAAVHGGRAAPLPPRGSPCRPPRHSRHPRAPRRPIRYLSAEVSRCTSIMTTVDIKPVRDSLIDSTTTAHLDGWLRRRRDSFTWTDRRISIQ